MNQNATIAFPEKEIQFPASLRLYRDNREEETNPVVAATRSTEPIVGYASTVSGMRDSIYPYTFKLFEDAQGDIVLAIEVVNSTNPLEITTKDGRQTSETNGTIKTREDANARIGSFEFEIEMPN